MSCWKVSPGDKKSRECPVVAYLVHGVKILFQSGSRDRAKIVFQDLDEILEVGKCQ